MDRGTAAGRGLRKRHGLQGPIDDAFMDCVHLRAADRQGGDTRPSSNGRTPRLDRAIEHWRRHFRGEARVKNDVDMTDDDIAVANLVLWGDPASNAVLDEHGRQAADPVGRRADHRRRAAVPTPTQHAPIAIYPNPLNPERYVVLNSGFTFREYAYLNNARQVPKLPDWAVVDLRTPPDCRSGRARSSTPTSSTRAGNCAPPRKQQPVGPDKADARPAGAMKLSQVE